MSRIAWNSEDLGLPRDKDGAPRCVDARRKHPPFSGRASGTAASVPHRRRDPYAVSAVDSQTGCDISIDGRERIRRAMAGRSPVAGIVRLDELAARARMRRSPNSTRGVGHQRHRTSEASGTVRSTRRRREDRSGRRFARRAYGEDGRPGSRRRRTVLVLQALRRNAWISFPLGPQIRGSRAHGRQYEPVPNAAQVPCATVLFVETRKTEPVELVICRHQAVCAALVE